MGRPTNEKRWACSLLTVSEARKLHETERGGDVRRQPQIEELIVPIAEIPYVVLHTYVDKPRQIHDEVVIHALCAELWVGNKPTAMTQPQHTFGLPPRLVKEYARQLLEALYQSYGDDRRSGFKRFAREEQHSVSQCPIRPCSYHAEHLQGREVGESR